jgi:hypothetical protein
MINPLTENDVVASAAELLASQGWRIVSTATTDQRGWDIVAERDFRRLLVEAKGAIAVKPKVPGRAFSSNQVRQSLEAGLFKIASALTEQPNAVRALAVPDTIGYRKHIAKIEPILFMADIHVIWVDVDGLATWDIG